MKPNVRYFLLIGVGAIVGAILNELLAQADAPGWLVNQLTLGLDPPFTVDLIVIQFTCGLTLSMSLASVIGMLVAVVAFRRSL